MALASKQTHRTKSVGHRKRQGLHQKRTQKFMKTYWPYIPMVSFVIAGIAINTLWSSQSKHAVLGSSTEISVVSLLNKTNAERSNNGINGLNLNSQLDLAAQAKANNMVTLNYWSHNTPSGQPPWSFITDAGYQYLAAGENLAYGFSDANLTVLGWMNSPEHRSNMLNQNYQDVGFGIANATNFQNNGPETVIVAMYAEPLGAAAATAPTSPPSQAPTTLNTATLPAKSIARVQLFSASSPAYITILVGAIAIIGFAIFVIRYSRKLQKVVIKSEKYVHDHLFFDNVVVLVIVVGFLLSRSAGIIH